MKVLFDTNVYIAEALLGRAAERMINATLAARWRIYCCTHILGEVQTVLLRLGLPSGSPRLRKIASGGGHPLFRLHPRVT
jgi:predicted nucleic acid-binding protein